MGQSKIEHRARLGSGSRKNTKRWASSLFLAGVIAALVACGSDYGGGYTTAPTSGGKELDSGNISPGATYQHRFASAGSFPYHCIYHAPMTGTVEVSTGAADTLVNVSITSSSAPFPAASVKPGGRVVWTNNTSVVHTVTSD